jgi:hypothetical protein
MDDHDPHLRPPFKKLEWPKAAAKITDDLDVLLAFYDYPAEHWIHLRTTNPIESTFAIVRLRQRVTKGPGSRAAGVAMAFKLIASAQTAVVSAGITRTKRPVARAVNDSPRVGGRFAGAAGKRRS